jgi:hypothetical protein
LPRLAIRIMLALYVIYIMPHFKNVSSEKPSANRSETFFHAY